jgi:hypothetical protein
MNNKVTIDFGNIISELEIKDINLCFLKDRGLFIEDNQKHLYRMNNLDYDSYLDKLIKNKRVVEFEYVGEVNGNINEWEKERWDITEINKFMNRQHLTQ